MHQTICVAHPRRCHSNHRLHSNHRPHSLPTDYTLTTTTTPSLPTPGREKKLQKSITNPLCDFTSSRKLAVRVLCSPSLCSHYCTFEKFLKGNHVLKIKSYFFPIDVCTSAAMSRSRLSRRSPRGYISLSPELIFRTSFNGTRVEIV